LKPNSQELHSRRKIPPFFFFDKKNPLLSLLSFCGGEVFRAWVKRQRAKILLGIITLNFTSNNMPVIKYYTCNNNEKYLIMFYKGAVQKQFVLSLESKFFLQSRGYYLW